MRRIVAAIAVTVVAVTAHAANPDERPIEVEVGHTVEVDVGYARGLICDDTSILDATLITRGDHNVFRVTGRKPGNTLCRVGTNPETPPWYLFHVSVIPERNR